MSRIEEIRARVHKATEGPWIEECGIIKHYVFSADHDFYMHEQELHADDGREVPAHYNCQFIAHAREDIPHLLSMLDRAREILLSLDERDGPFESVEGWMEDFNN